MAIEWLAVHITDKRRCGVNLNIGAAATTRVDECAALDYV
jgi:hypothetical protein